MEKISGHYFILSVEFFRVGADKKA